MQGPGAQADFAAVDALLDATGPVDDGLPAVAERRRLRRAWKLTQDQVAVKVGVSRETVSGWETGRWEPEPGSKPRALYVHLLTGIQKRLEVREAAQQPQTRNDGPTAPGADTASQNTAHAERAPSAAAPPPRVPSSKRYASTSRPARQVRPGRASGKDAPGEGELFIADRVHEALSENGGDAEAAIADLEYKAIPDAMHLLEISRRTGRYDFTYHAVLPPIFDKKPGREGNDIWEARPKWSAPDTVLPPGAEVTALDVNGAYLSALKAHLPIGTLEHHLGPAEGGPAYDKRRSGVHLITPPDWHHEALPNPIGNREEPGRLWVTESTLRLLQRCSSPRYGLCDELLIHESWTSGESEGLLEGLRLTFAAARKNALENDDEVTLAYVKAMYAKFVSTAGSSTYNRELNRQDWVHIIRSQAFANLWGKAYKAHTNGLTVAGILGTDELHLIGDWQTVFTEGRDIAQVKIKNTYTLTRGEAAGA